SAPVVAPLVAAPGLVISFRGAYRLLRGPLLRRQLHPPARRARALPGGDDLLDVAPDVGGAEAGHVAARAHAGEEMRGAVALVGTERRRIEEAAALRRDDLHAPGPGALALARRARLVDEQRPALAVDDHREGRLAADLGPARFEQPQRAGVGEDDHRVVFGDEARLARRRCHRGDRLRPAEHEATEHRAVPAVVDERAAAVSPRVVEPVAELRRAAELTRPRVAAAVAQLDRRA